MPDAECHRNGAEDAGFPGTVIADEQRETGIKFQIEMLDSAEVVDLDGINSHGGRLGAGFGNGKFTGDGGGDIEVWEEPREGKRYLVGCDPATGASQTTWKNPTGARSWCGGRNLSIRSPGSITGPDGKDEARGGENDDDVMCAGMCRYAIPVATEYRRAVRPIRFG